MFKDLKIPVIQAPMAGGIVTPELIAAVSNAGMLGSVATGYLSLQDCDAMLNKVRSLTKNPVLVNVFIEKVRNNQNEYPKPQTIIQIEQHIIGDSLPSFAVPATISQEEYLSLLLKYKIEYVSSTFGFFKPSIIRKLKSHGIQILASVTNLEEACHVVANGADGLILQGIEAGGHQASFENSSLSELTTIELFKQIKTRGFGLPIIVSGGINLGNMLDYWRLGADMVQLGTVFMLSNLSSLDKNLVDYILVNNETRLTQSITGKWVRAVKNKLVEEITKPDYPFPVQHYLTAKMRSDAKRLKKYDYSGIWLGKHSQYKYYDIQDLLLGINQLYTQFTNQSNK